MMMNVFIEKIFLILIAYKYHLSSVSNSLKFQ